MSPASGGAPATPGPTSPAGAQPMRPTHKAGFDYEAKQFDEVQLRRGDLLFVTEMGPDGWYIGQNLSTGDFGTFPGNFVVAFKSEQQAQTELDALLAARLQQEENARLQRQRSESMAHARQDEQLARRLQMEEDRQMAVRAASGSERGAGAGGGGRDGWWEAVFG